MQTMMRTTLLVLALVPWGTESALAQAYPPPASSPPLASNPPSQSGQYSSNEVIDAGHRFFGTISHGLAEIVEKAGSQWGLPNGYVLGQEGRRRLGRRSALRGRHVDLESVLGGTWHPATDKEIFRLRKDAWPPVEKVSHATIIANYPTQCTSPLLGLVWSLAHPGGPCVWPTPARR
jgi:hypothetical protein